MENQHLHKSYLSKQEAETLAELTALRAAHAEAQAENQALRQIISFAADRLDTPMTGNVTAARAKALRLSLLNALDR